MALTKADQKKLLASWEKQLAQIAETEDKIEVAEQDVKNLILPAQQNKSKEIMESLRDMPVGASFPFVYQG